MYVARVKRVGLFLILAGLVLTVGPATAVPLAKLKEMELRLGVDPVFRRLSPQMGQAGTAVSLTLEGDGLSNVGVLTDVTIGGVNMQQFDAVIVSDQSIEISVLIRDDTPTGEQQIAFFFENADFESNFSVLEADGREPDVLIATPESGGGVATILGLPLALVFLGGALLLALVVLLGLACLFAWRQVRSGGSTSSRRGPPER